MVAWVLDAIRASEAADWLVLVGAAPPGQVLDRLVPDHGGFVENLLAGVDACRGHDGVVVVSADLPFLTPEAVRDTAEAALSLDAELVYPIVEVERCYRSYPGMKRTTLRLREGVYTGGNAVFVRPELLARQRERISAVYAARKSPLRLGLMVGPLTALRVIAAGLPVPPMLSLHGLEGAVSRLVGGRARALESPHASIATDVDRPEDLAIADKLLMTTD